MATDRRITERWTALTVGPTTETNTSIARPPMVEATLVPASFRVGRAPFVARGRIKPEDETETRRQLGSRRHVVDAPSSQRETLEEAQGTATAPARLEGRPPIMSAIKERITTGHKVAGVIHVVQMKTEPGLQATGIQFQPARDTAVALPSGPPEPSTEGVDTARTLP